MIAGVDLILAALHSGDQPAAVRRPARPPNSGDGGCRPRRLCVELGDGTASAPRGLRQLATCRWVQRESRVRWPRARQSPRQEVWP